MRYSKVSPSMWSLAVLLSSVCTVATHCDTITDDLPVEGNVPLRLGAPPLNRTVGRVACGREGVKYALPGDPAIFNLTVHKSLSTAPPGCSLHRGHRSRQTFPPVVPSGTPEPIITRRGCRPSASSASSPASLISCSCSGHSHPCKNVNRTRMAIPNRPIWPGVCAESARGRQIGAEIRGKFVQDHMKPWILGKG